MHLLTDTTHSITLVTTVAISTDWVANWADQTTTTFTPGSGSGNVSTATTTTIVAAPAASTQRQVKNAVVTNRHASTIQTVQLFRVVGASSYAITEVIALAAGQCLLVNADGWIIRNTVTQVVVATGKILYVSNTLTLAGTDGTTVTFPSTSSTIARTDTGQTFTGANIFSNSSGAGVNIRGYCTDVTSGNASAINGEMTLGSTAAYQFRLSYGGSKTGEEHVFYNNTYDLTGRGHVFRVRTAGTPVDVVKIIDTDVTVYKVLKVTDTTNSTSTTTGSGVFSGGLAVAKDFFLGGVVNQTFTTTNNTSAYAIFTTMTVNHTASGNYVFAGNGSYCKTDASDAYNVGSILGHYGIARHYGTGNITSTLSSLRGSALNYSSNSSATIAKLHALEAFLWGNTVSGGAVVTEASGLYIPSPDTTGTINNLYGIYLESITGGSTVTFCIYTNSGIISFGDDLKLHTVGKGLFIKEGTNAKMGTATLSSGAATVSTTAVSATSRILLTTQSLGTVTAPKAIAVTARTAGTSFTITSADATDTSVIAWVILDPA